MYLRDGHGGRFNSRDSFARLGNSIGTNTHLTNLEVTIRHGIELDVTHREFFQGLMQNNSIKKIKLLCNGRYTLGRPIINEILKAYWKIGNNNLVDLSIDDINLQNGGEHVLATTLQSCVNLTKLNITNSGISNEEQQLHALVDSIRGNDSSLEVLELRGNRIGDAGCLILSDLLFTNLRVLRLADNGIGNKGAITIANNLAFIDNNKLRELILARNPIDINASDAFSRLLCNTSSINQTYSSNHTLSQLFLPEHDNPNHLNYLLKLNREANKSYVAMRKLLRYHKLDMEQFFGWDAEGEWTLKGVLPYVVAWFDKAQEAVRMRDRYPDDSDSEEECYVENRKLLEQYTNLQRPCHYSLQFLLVSK